MLVRVLTLFTVLQLALADEVAVPNNATRLETRNVADYYFSQYPLKPIDAARDCTNRNMWLVGIENMDEVLEIANHIYTVLQTPDETYWTSGLRLENDWIWSSTGLLLNYDFWESGQPNEPAYPNQACIYMTQGKLYDRPCNFAQKFICEPVICPKTATASSWTLK